MELQRARDEIAAVDAEMARLFVRRMEAAGRIAAYKRERGLPIEDKAQEARVLESRGRLIEDREMRACYLQFLQQTMEVSKRWQRHLTDGCKNGTTRFEEDATMRTIRMELGKDSYDILLERGCLRRAGELLKLDRRVLIVTDDAVPPQYARALADQCARPVIHTVPHGEGSKCLARVEELLRVMLEHRFSRRDCVCAVGGGVMGDLAGFTAACYMRGVDFYNLPTTVLSQVDSSIGGKTGVDLAGVKNIVGAFWQPRRVLIDPDTLSTLPPEQTANGMAEAVKTGLIGDASLFGLFETGSAAADPERMIAASLRVKKSVVEADERESGPRRALNFGHTIGHGIETVTGLLHGQCVALGMIPMCSPAVRARLLPVLESLGLPTRVQADPEAVYEAMCHDKKADGGTVCAVRVEEPGRFLLEDTTLAALRPLIDQVVIP